MKKIYVGNLSYSLKTSKLKEYFSKYGEISDCIIVRDRYTGKSRGYGFVTFLSQKNAETAVIESAGDHLDGRKIFINFAQGEKNE